MRISAPGATACRITTSAVVTGFPVTTACSTGAILSGRVGSITGPGRSIIFRVTASADRRSVTKSIGLEQGGTVRFESGSQSTQPVVHLDPTFTQDATNQLKVTYELSADAVAGNGARSGLASGILDFYSDGLLRCSFAVTESDNSGTCTVTYKKFGLHTVITEYLSGTNSATETDQEDIEPVPPYQDSLSLQYGQSSGAQDASGVQATCPNPLHASNPCFAIYTEVSGPFGAVTSDPPQNPTVATPVPAGSITITVLDDSGNTLVSLTTEKAGQSGCFVEWHDTPPAPPTSPDCSETGSGVSYVTQSLNVTATFSAPDYRPLTTSIVTQPYTTVTASA